MNDSERPSGVGGAAPTGERVGSGVTRWSLVVLVSLVGCGLLARAWGLADGPLEAWIAMPSSAALHLTLFACAIGAIIRRSRGVRIVAMLALALPTMSSISNAIGAGLLGWPAGQRLVSEFGWTQTGQSAGLHLILGLALVATLHAGRTSGGVRATALVIVLLGAAGALWGHALGGAGVSFVPNLAPMSALVAMATLTAAVAVVAAAPERWPLAAMITSDADHRLVATLLPFVVVVPTLGPTVAAVVARVGGGVEVTRVIGPTITLAAMLWFLGLVQRSHRRLVAEVAARDAQLLGVLDGLPVAVMLRAADGTLLHRNPGTERFLRRLGVDVSAVDSSPESLMDHLEVVDEDGRAPARETLPVVAALRDGRPHSATLGYSLPDGGRAWYSARAAPVQLTDQTTGVVLTLDDVTEQHEARRRVTVAERSLRRTFDQAPIGIGVHAVDGRLVQVNAALCALLAYDEHTLLTNGLPWATDAGDAPTDVMTSFAGWALGAPGSGVEERRLRHADGTVLVVEVATAVISDDDHKPMRLIVQVVDVTAQRALEEELRLAAVQDPLTGLSNRRALAEELDTALHRQTRGGGDVGVLYLDLDGFKAVNDSFGHEVGDRVLCDTAGRLLAATRETDTVCRLGGDEFVVLCTPVDGQPGLDELADRVAARPSVTVEVGDRAIAVTGSVGAVVVEPGEDLDAVLRRADAAMYRAKRAATGDGGRPTPSNATIAR